MKDEMKSILEIILAKDKILFVIEKVELDNGTKFYRLKRRKIIKLLNFHVNTFDEYEVNCLNNKINFASVEDIEFYLKIQFSDPEGFIVKTHDIK